MFINTNNQTRTYVAPQQQDQEVNELSREEAIYRVRRFTTNEAPEMQPQATLTREQALARVVHGGGAVGCGCANTPAYTEVAPGLTMPTFLANEVRRIEAEEQATLTREQALARVVHGGGSSCCSCANHPTPSAVPPCNLSVEEQARHERPIITREEAFNMVNRARTNAPAASQPQPQSQPQQQEQNAEERKLEALSHVIKTNGMTIPQVMEVAYREEAKAAARNLVIRTSNTPVVETAGEVETPATGNIAPITAAELGEEERYPFGFYNHRDLNNLRVNPTCTLDIVLWEIDFDQIHNETCPPWVKQIMTEDHWELIKDSSGDVADDTLEIPGTYFNLQGDHTYYTTRYYFDDDESDVRAIAVINGKVYVVTYQDYDTLVMLLNRNTPVI